MVLVVSLVLFAGIIVLGFVSGLLANVFSDRAEESRIGAAKAACKALAYAIVAYEIGGGDLPADEKAWQTLMQSGIIKNPRDFTDPWGRMLQLKKDGEGHIVWSKGKDGIGGTSDDIMQSTLPLR